MRDQLSDRDGGRQRPNGDPPMKLNAGVRIALFVMLFTIAIPWWWRFFVTTGNQLVLGAPTWVVTSVLTSVVISIFTARSLAVAWSAGDVDDAQGETSDER